MDIGGKIKKLRDGQNLSQDALASQLGISQATLYNIESGDSQKIDFLLMEKICHFFKKYFFYFSKENIVLFL
jgi:transcriptional regulator with XRE-family HTH domain